MPWKRMSTIPAAISESKPTAPSLPPGRVPLRRAVWLIFASFASMFIAGSIYSMMRSGIAEARQSDELQSAHEIGMSLYKYANDHNGQFPQGKSSTEIFQQLLDQKYADDPAIFYFPMRGKSRPEGKGLKPENVCWDVTADVGPHDPDSLPIVFLTGYKARYGSSPEVAGFDAGTYVAVMTKGGWAHILKPDDDGTIQFLIAEDYKPSVHPYRQLTPDGPLP